MMRELARDRNSSNAANSESSEKLDFSFDSPREAALFTAEALAIEVAGDSPSAHRIENLLCIFAAAIRRIDTKKYVAFIEPVRDALFPHFNLLKFLLKASVESNDTSHISAIVDGFAEILSLLAWISQEKLSGFSVRDDSRCIENEAKEFRALHLAFSADFAKCLMTGFSFNVLPWHENEINIEYSEMYQDFCIKLNVRRLLAIYFDTYNACSG
ncbi:hypothetical protein HK100_005196 [Physocladia obscura]|uniref:Uncharacterized protein n=1 Tax=Physocladia obscura TaxID=109957 RepID=A0AAD5XC24_9FUNG|nr:hypothetical protein HK100_005196 [Physocladia obscura]